MDSENVDSVSANQSGTSSAADADAGMASAAAATTGSTVSFKSVGFHRSSSDSLSVSKLLNQSGTSAFVFAGSGWLGKGGRCDARKISGSSSRPGSSSNP